ncbi:TPA: hypothetical protein HA238_05920 [Candidatus Micrarchaeota archaeon]|nr:hypothetical protein [Candidatus Micrarchaeota archaeon]
MENVTLDVLYSELKYLHKKIESLEQILIPEAAATQRDKDQLEDALREHRQGKSVKFSDIRKD